MRKTVGAFTQCSSYISVIVVGLLLGLNVSCISSVKTGNPKSLQSYTPVDCLLPGRIHRIGRYNTFVGPKRLIKATAEQCVVKAGEYILHDPGDLNNILYQWLKQAKKGDAEAQYYAGMVYEQGPKGKPDFEKAAIWYRKSAEQGFTRAAFNLARLYKEGLGVKQSHAEAVKWTSQATGLKPEELEGIGYSPSHTRKKFQAPRIEIYDPPLTITRGQQIFTGAIDSPEVDRASLADVPTVTVAEDSQHISGRVLASAGLKAFTINGENIEVDEEKKFHALRPKPDPGSDRALVEILAIDRDDKETRLQFAITYGEEVTPIAPSISPQDLSEFGNYFALVIGNNEYNHWSHLSNAIPDAKAIGAVLKDRYGFTTTVLENADFEQIRNSLYQIIDKMTANDNLLIYYAGHGQRLESIDVGYWIPVDGHGTKSKKLQNWIRLREVVEAVEISSAKHILVIADSCFSGKLTRGEPQPPGAALTEAEQREANKKMARLRVRRALTSGGLHPVPDGGADGHSLFANELLNFLKRNRGVVNSNVLFNTVESRIINKSITQQRPTYDTIHLAGANSDGHFIFVPKSIAN